MQSVFILPPKKRLLAVIRYNVLVGASALAGALALRIAHKPEWIGALLGLLAGALAFRDQLRPLSWPRLYLSQKALYLVQKRRAVGIPWEVVARVGDALGLVEVALKGPVRTPDGNVIEAVRLDAQKLGTTTPALIEALRSALADPTPLPADAEVRERLGQLVVR